MNNRLFLLLPLAFFALLPSVVLAETNGRLVKSDESTAVYYIGEEGKRHAFPNQRVYESWYEDFSTVETITSSELASFPLGKNVLYRAGSRLIKVPSVSEVYAVEPFGRLRNIPSEEVAIALYGDEWAKKVDDIDISFFFDYDIIGAVEVIENEPVHPVGSILAFNQEFYLVDRRTDGLWMLRPVTDDAWAGNQFSMLEYSIPQWGFIPFFMELGPTVFDYEATFSCVYCSKGTLARLSVKETTTFESEGHSVEHPDSFQPSFEYNSVVDNNAIKLVESNFIGDDDIVDLFSYVIFPKEMVPSVEDLLAVYEADAEIYYHQGKSPQRPSSTESIFIKDGTFEWHLISETGQDIIDIAYIGDRAIFERYLDVFDLVMKTLVIPTL